MKKPPLKKPARPEIRVATIHLTDGRVIRKDPSDQLWHLYEKENAAGYRRLQQGEVRELLGTLGLR